MSMWLSFPETVFKNLWGKKMGAKTKLLHLYFCLVYLNIFIWYFTWFSGDLIPFRKCWWNDFHTSRCWRNSRVPVTTAGQAGSKPVVMDVATRLKVCSFEMRANDSERLFGKSKGHKVRQWNPCFPRWWRLEGGVDCEPLNNIIGCSHLKMDK